MRTTRTHEALSLWHRRAGAVSKYQWNRLAQQRQQDQLRANASLSLPMMDPNLVVLRTEDFVSVSCRIRNSISRCNNRKPHTINSCHGHIFFKKKGVEKSFGDPLGECAEMAKILHGEINALDDAGNIRKARQIDSQAKHGVIARGGAEYYVRLPVAGYREWIWDQAAGSVVLQEAGGKMTDTAGNVIDFGLGAKLSDTVKGVLASNGGIFHDALVQAYEKQKQNQEYR